MRLRIAQEAARIMAEEGVHDFLAAKRKAAARLGAADTRHLPRNTEIEQALIDYQRLFQPDVHAHRLERLRSAALESMRFLDRFDPRLVGSVLSGTANEHSDVNLHLFADTPEDVVLFLMQEHIPFQTSERRLRLTNQSSEMYPVYRFLAGDTPIDLTVFPRAGLRQAPLSAVDGKPMRRASTPALRELMETGREGK
ncbi:MAG: hypothetical protein KGJ12_00630 [Gammaproteobacteria bacterium]|nr:hypothetical protein [Gammaproteobacteria bacterium]